MKNHPHPFIEWGEVEEEQCQDILSGVCLGFHTSLMENRMKIFNIQ
jgi:hypothetical protein